MYAIERFGGLERLPRIPLCRLPTPVEELPDVSASLGVPVWCKRDDRTADVYGGNKVRKLEWLLGDARARESDALVTVGAWGSHHVLATAVHGAAHGFAVHAIVIPQRLTAHVEDDLRADLAAGAVLHPTKSWMTVAPVVAGTAARLRWRDKRRPTIVPPGGTSPTGALGYVAAGLELGRQIDRAECPEPRAVYVAAGSGGTVAGLAVGLAAAGITSRLVAVRVTSRLVLGRGRIARLVDGTVSLVRSVEPRFPRVSRDAMSRLDFDDSQVGLGYGDADDAVRDAIALAAADGLILDDTYTGKTFAALVRAARTGTQGPLLFVNTLSSAPMAPLLEGAPALPSWAG